MEDQDRNNGGPSWKVRRGIIFSTLIFCAICILYIMLMGEDTRVNEAIVLGCFGLAASVIGSYIFGAVWQDNTTRKHVIGGPMIEGGQRTKVKTEVKPDPDRRERAKARLARIKARRSGVDNPDA